MATHGEARRKGRLPGYAVRLDSNRGLTLYLADYRRGGHVATPYPALAEWFEWAADAREMARRVTRYTGQRWLATVIPADCRPTSADAPPDEADAPPDEADAPNLLSTLESVERFTVGRIDREENLPDDERAMLAAVREAIAGAKGGQS